MVIKREAARLTDPRTYHASMSLEAVKTIEFTAPADGYVRTVSARPGLKLKTQGEAFRMDDTRAALVVKRARAGVQAAQIEKKLAQAKNDADLTALAEARLEGAQAEADLAQYEAEQLVIRGPFGGEIQRVNVVEGQFVRAGEKLGLLIDPSKLWVEVPVERANAAPGSMIDVTVEGTVVKAKVESVIALAAKFGALRELTVSPASAIVTIDNSGGKLAAGQTVYSDLIPLAPVTQVASSGVSNATDGNRKVKVLRDNIIRDVQVKILAKVGTDSVFVSGRFNEGDEVITYSSRDLVDGTPLRALAAGAGSAGAANGKSTGRPAGAGKTPAGTKKTQEGF
ncbi:MAG: HlyD family efflux transporter periplasmic adaptor subunit [Planctomycetia bacterium]|nr:HlyD family efflux transporter periplasmic adaptor subunit [Planctomycetia bacterium]